MARTKPKRESVAALKAEVRLLRRVVRRQNDCISYIIQAAADSHDKLAAQLNELRRQDPDFLNFAKGC